MNQEEFINNFASGSLAKAYKLGLNWKDLFYKEYVAFAYGWYFEPVKASRVTTGPVLMEGDSHVHTEFVWHLTRWKHLRPDIIITPCYLIIENEDGSRREGLGVTVNNSETILPKCYSIIALMAEYKNGSYTECHPI